MKILVADDDRELLDLLTFAFQRAGFEIIQASDGEQAIVRFQEQQPALALLDVNMPKLDGFQVCQRLRLQSSVPIIMLTVRNQEEEILRAFELGADDYLTKPFSPRQLVARVKAALRRSGMSTPNLLSIGNIRLAPERHEIYLRGGEAIRLTPLEFRLLHVLMQNQDRVMSAVELVEQVWGYEERSGDRVLLKGLVARVRKKIDADPCQPSFIKTVPGAGYAFSTM